MKFLKGKVEITVDQNKEGRFKVTPLDRPPDSNTIVNYVSPYYDVHSGGMFAVPAHGSEVLMAYDEVLGEYFYLGTIVGKSRFTPGVDDSVKNAVVSERLAYNSDGSPCIMTYTNSDSAGLKINNFQDGKDKHLVKSVVLRSSLGHSLELSDNPMRDKVTLKNKNQEGITIMGDATQADALPSRSIGLETLDTISAKATTGDIRVNLTHGREITIKNSSDGVAGGRKVDTPLGEINPIPAGNLNLVTSWKDINIYTEGLPSIPTGDAGRILISTPQGLIQIKSGSAGLTLYSEGTINIASVKALKTFFVESLGTDPALQLPNITGQVNVWEVSPGQTVSNGQIIGYLTAGTVTPQTIPIVSPHDGILLQQLAQPGTPLTLFSPLGIIQTAGGTINLEATDNINLKAGQQVNITGNLGVTTQSLGPISVKSQSELNLNSALKTTVESPTEVVVAGTTFTMGAATSNISPANGGGTIYAPSPTPADTEPVIPALVGTIIPEIGAYVLKGQP
jgi:hypothetical protein